MNSSNLTTFNTTATPSLYTTYRVGLAVWFGAMMTFCIGGTILNLLVMSIILSTAKLRIGSGILIAHLLAVLTSHCAVHLFLITVSTYCYAPYYPLSTPFCVYTTWMYYTCINAVNWSSLLIGINRFIAIFFPMKYSVLIQNKVIVVMILSIWAVCFGCSTQIVYGRAGTYGVTAPWGTCGITKPDVNFAIVTNVNVTLPLTILGLLYLGIFIGVAVKNRLDQRQIRAEQKTVVKKGDNVQTRRLFERRYRSAKILFVSYLWYVATLMPAPIALSLYPVAYVKLPLLSLIIRAVFLVGYATIPLIFLMMNAEYRRRLRSICKIFNKFLAKDKQLPAINQERSAEFATVVALRSSVKSGMKY
ncbi:alpha-1A adrenergic receptor-like isoform X2 [Paramacrobiotus metropolitanus]|nr:alpha-1A adrenergic receptor-like isoform X2 [Paramacrobiotus metropolitanus]